MPEPPLPGYDPNQKFETEFFLRQFLTPAELDAKAREQLPPLDEPRPTGSMGDRARAIVNGQIAAGLRPNALVDSSGAPLPSLVKVPFSSAVQGSVIGAAPAANGAIQPKPFRPAPSQPPSDVQLYQRVPSGDRGLQQGFAETIGRGTDADIAEIANLYEQGVYKPEGDFNLGFQEAIQKARAGGRIVLIWDPAQRRYVYVTATYAAILQAAQGVAGDFHLLDGSRPGIELPGAQGLPSGFVDVPSRDPILDAGRGIIGGIINPGGGEPSNPGITPTKPIRPPMPGKDDKGNIVQPGGFLDELFRRNPADP